MPRLVRKERGREKGKSFLFSTHLTRARRQGNAVDAGGHGESQAVANGQQMRESSGRTAGRQMPAEDDGQH